MEFEAKFEANSFQIPVVHWLAVLGKSLYNPGEESIDGHMVKRADLYNDPKSIQGKLIVKILPEGHVQHMIGRI